MSKNIKEMMNKKHIATLVLFLTLALGATAQPVMVERQGRAEHIKSYYAPEKGYLVDVSLGYVLGINGINSYASQSPSPSLALSVGYSFSKNWKAYLTYQRGVFLQDTGYDRLMINDYQAVSGEKVHDCTINNFMVGGDYTFDISQYIKPYVGVSLGIGGVEFSTEISDTYAFSGKSWLPVVAPEVGMRGFFDKRLTYGYKVNATYGQYFGTVETIDAKVSSPSFLRIAVGVFVKIL